MHGLTGPMPVAAARLALGGLLCGALLMVCAPALAQDAPAEVTPGTVVAKVGDDTITEADIAFAAEEMQADLARMPLEARKPFLLSMIIDMKVMAQAARAAQMDQSEIFARRLTYLRDRALNRAFFADRIASAVTAEAVQAAYDKYVAEYGEVHVRHILLTTEEDALAVKAELEAGADFATVAAEKSIDPSAQQNGGDLGFVPRGRTVQPFEDAAFAMTTPGQLSDPVQTQFGWHIILFEEARAGTPAPFEQKAPEIEQMLLAESYESTLDGLKSGISISIEDPALAEAVTAQQ